MAAGLGFKDFVTGEVLTAADVDGYLMQGIWVFASAAARDAAVTSPQEGNACYLKDTNQVLTYSGSAWVAVGGGSPLTTKGDLYGFSTVDARIPIGANNTVLTADSTQALGLKWAAPVGGKVLQVIQASTSTSATATGAGFVDSNLSGTITPSATSSKILILTAQYIQLYRAGQDQGLQIKLLRGATTIFDPNNSVEFVYTRGAGISTLDFRLSVPLAYLDSPSSTSALTYKTQFTGTYASPAYATAQSGGITSTMILMEIGA